MRGAPLAALVVAAAVAGRPAPTFACGAGGGGAAGVSACSLEEHAEAMRLKLRLGAAYGFTSTRISFGASGTADQERHTALATVDYRLSPAVTLRAGAGAFLAGSLSLPSGAHDMGPGPAALVGASFRVLDADGARPFVLLTADLAGLLSSTKARGVVGAPSVAYSALDLRAGVVAGIPIERVVTPYVAARVFGGPIGWSTAGASVTGTDAYHVQLGLGLSVLLFRRVDLFVEGVPLGERGVATGVGVAL